MAETFRSASAPSAAHPPAHKDEEKMSVFWRVFGGTILSIVALVGITIFNNIQSSITELRGEITRSREALAGVALGLGFFVGTRTRHEGTPQPVQLSADIGADTKLNSITGIAMVVSPD